MSFGWEAVQPAVIEVFRGVSTACRGTGFYLADGTALALRLGHRESVDLDFFSSDFEDVDHLKATLSGVLPDPVVTLAASRTLHALASGVQISFFGYRYPALVPPDEPAPGLLPLAGVADIAAMKLAAIASRGSRKDFVDLWFILDQGTSIEQALDWFRRKYPMTDIGHVVRALVYFDDADLEPELRMLRPGKWSDVKRSLRCSVERLLGS